MLVADVLVANPASVQVFAVRRMECARCVFARFETVAEAARAYGIEPWDLACALADAHSPSPHTFEESR